MGFFIILIGHGLRNGTNPNPPVGYYTIEKSQKCFDIKGIGRDSSRGRESGEQYRGGKEEEGPTILLDP